ncbi:hypothetical protein M0802_016593 [Mischocyttarus mexicanus]|nr:hypothetical protein M0802_016593 [Mischocyttarus mexicanus]
MDADKKRGRKTNVERLTRARSASRGRTAGVSELWRRQKEREGEEEKVFSRSTIIPRSPGGSEGEGSGRGEADGLRSKDWMTEVREEIKKDRERSKEEWKREMERSKEEWKREMERSKEEWKREMERSKGEWKLEMERREERIGELEKKVEELEKRLQEAGKDGKRSQETEERVVEGCKAGGRVQREEEEEEGIGRKVKEMEEKMERREREERRRNVIIKRVKMGRSARETAENMLGRIGAEVKIVEAREIGKRRKQGEETMLEVKLESVEGKREVMSRKGKLQGRREIIGDDWTWKERKMQWRLREIGSEEAGRGKWVRVGYGRVNINGVVWVWDEEGEKLRDGRGREWVRGGEQRVAQKN